MLAHYLIIQASEAVSVRSDLNDYDLFQHQDNISLNVMVKYFIYLNVLYKHGCTLPENDPKEMVETCGSSSVVI